MRLLRTLLASASVVASAASAMPWLPIDPYAPTAGATVPTRDSLDLNDPAISVADYVTYNGSFCEDAVYSALDLDSGDGSGDPDLPGWIDPRTYGGSMLDLVGNGLREPINVIISGKSDKHVLSDLGLKDYIRTIGFSFECLNLHMGNLQRADLGDGKGWTPEMFEYRETGFPGAPGRWVGACWESLYGGNHFRVWKQNGTLANTGAWFLAVSKEKNLKYHHTIDQDGYNAGRDLLVAAAERGGKWNNVYYKAEVEWVDGLLEAGRHGINHNIGQDGRTAILTVKKVDALSRGFFFWGFEAITNWIAERIAAKLGKLLQQLGIL
ncbi:uncharacterized protein UMAG_00159 [Mycosarcoma maydis]|uniref:Secreted protein n=1 Tax=Mycosarcoma maydis TaxID=5270 RepID=A0A0D1E8C1_MYCMD|nr:uncharacterized protein UMAG_00159 [Ustilago maydis 521]KIS71721.1 hypothetical protein UMAG_00159 [Ustilago maydis 521]|eukprot:XP_011386106.1 hypothetical protein UMAG_00159 [Ustilago maydis 521]